MSKVNDRREAPRQSLNLLDRFAPSYKLSARDNILVALADGVHCPEMGALRLFGGSS